MARKVIIAGAGHGGLVAAAYLAEKEGYIVELYEAAKKEDLGHDWHDTMKNNTFERAGIKEFDKKDIEFRKESTFLAPSLRTPIAFDIDKDMREIEIDRKVLYKYLINNAIEKGVHMYYSTRVDAPLVDKDNKVIGLIIEGKEVEADMVIDSAGLNSPVISQLPKSYGISNNYGENNIFHAYRAYYNLIKGAEITNKERFNIYFMFEGIKGIAWFKVTEGKADVLVGSVEPLSKERVEEVIQALRKVQPSIGTKLLRGGQIKDIPLKSTFSLLVGENYAAVGDAVSMPIPLNGSGITNSIIAGQLLAETILAIDKEEKGYTTSELWNYQVKYYQEIACQMISINILKNCLLGYSKDTLDFIFDKGILTAKELAAGANGKDVEMSNTEIFEKLRRGYKKPMALLKLKFAVKNSKAAKALYANIPTVYEKEAVDAWRKKVERYLK